MPKIIITEAMLRSILEAALLDIHEDEDLVSEKIDFILEEAKEESAPDFSE